MGKGDRKTKKGKIFKKSYGNSRLKDSRKRNLISLNQLRKWSKERLYFQIGRFDYTVSITFKKGSDSYNSFGRNITGTIYYTKRDRQLLNMKINSGVRIETNGNVLFTAILKETLSNDQIKLLAKQGFNTVDIFDITYYPYKHNPTYYQKKDKKLMDPISIKISDDLDYKSSYLINYKLFKRRIDSQDSLIDWEKLKMMAIKQVFNISEDDPKYSFTELVEKRKADYDFMVEDILLWIGEIKSYSDKTLGNKLEEVQKVVFHEFAKAGINLDQTSEKIKHFGLYSALLQIGLRYQDEIILYGTKPKVVLDFKGFMHVAFRHCDVCKVGKNNSLKSRIPYELNDLERLIASCLHLMEDDINDHFRTNPNKRFSRFKDELVRFNGDYYEIHINPKGYIETFYNHDQ